MSIDPYFFKGGIMYKKIRFTILNIFLLCVAFGILFFIKVNSYAAVAHTVTCTQTLLENNIWREWGIPSTSSDRRLAFYNLEYQHRYILCSNERSSFTISTWIASTGQNAVSSSFSARFEEWDLLFGGGYRFYGVSNEPSNFTFSTYNNAVYNLDGIPLFSDLDDLSYYLEYGTMPELPFCDDIKLDNFKVYMKGVWNWDLVRPQFNTVVVCPIWSNPDINDVEISIYAVDPSYRYNTVNYSYDSNMSGQLQTLDILGLTLHGQKFVVRATPFSQTTRGVSIQYELVFPETFDQPIGQLVIPTDNTYPYSTTLDISGNDVPIEWTVTQTPIYVYETNNIENYYYGDPVSYPVPEINENTENNYYETYVNNYYNTYNEVVNNYDVNFDIDISDVSGSDIQQTYDDFGNFFKGFGGFIGKLALLFSGLFPFLSPLVATTLVTVVGIIVLGSIVVLFLKVLHIL